MFCINVWTYWTTSPRKSYKPLTTHKVKKQQMCLTYLPTAEACNNHIGQRGNLKAGKRNFVQKGIAFKKENPLIGSGAELQN